MSSEEVVKKRLSEMLVGGADDIMIVDSRASSLKGKAMGVRCFVQKSTGFIIVKDEVLYNSVIRSSLKIPSGIVESVLIVDDRTAFAMWDNCFDSNNDLQILVSSSRIAIGNDKKLMMHDKLNSMNPQTVMQVKSVDESGQKMEFDSDVLNNGHLAIMMAIKTAESIARNNILIENTEVAFYGNDDVVDDDDDDDDGFMPFTVFK